MAMKITKLTNLDTKGVAVVHRGANNKRVALTKGRDPNETFEEMCLHVIAKGDMPLDEQAIDDMCAASGADPQLAETFKAIMKLSYVYRDSDVMKGLLKQAFATATIPGQAQPGAPGAPGGQPNPMQPGAAPAQTPGQPPVAAQGAGGQPPPFGAKPAGDKPPFGAKPGEEGGDDEAAAEKELADAEAALADAGEEETDETPDEGDDKKEPKKMDHKEKEKLEKATQEAVAKAADAEKKIADQELVIKSQQAALESTNKAVSEMRDGLKMAEWVSKAKEDLAFFPGQTPVELGKQLFDLEKVDPKIAQSTFETFKKTAEMVQNSSMFRASGGAGPAPARPNSVMAEVEKLVSERVAKGDLNGMSREVQIAKAEQDVFRSNPTLYKRYCDEQAKLNKAAH